MAFFKFTKGVLEGTPIEVYNNGDMYRDFTFITDLVYGIRLLLDTPPPPPEGRGELSPHDSISPAAPYRVVNIGNGEKVRLLDFIEAIERACARPAIRNYLPMQKGDVQATWADNSLLRDLTGYTPQTRVPEGIEQFVAWYREYYGV